MHNIKEDKARKILIASLSGSIDIPQANAMLSDFKKATAGLNSKQYVLIINPENISAGLFVIPILQNFIKLVSELRFKRIYLTNSDKYAALIQQHLANTEVASTLRFAASVTDAVNSN